MSFTVLEIVLIHFPPKYFFTEAKAEAVAPAFFEEEFAIFHPFLRHETKTEAFVHTDVLPLKV